MKLSLKEFFLKEYEDPTSSKHSTDDSKWAGPNSDKEGVPHEEPQDMAQSNSSEAWEETRDNGPEKQTDDSSLKGFFGGASAPKSSHKSSEKVSEGGKGSGRKKGSKNKPRDEFGGPPSKPEPHQGEIPDELPDEWVDDQPAMGQPPKPPEGEAGGDEGEIDWDSLEGDEFTDALAGSGKGPEIKTQPAMPKMKDTISTSPAAPSKPYQSFDPDQYDIDPGQIKDRDVWAGENENEQSWDEVRATAPKQAAELEKEFPAEELQGARFRKQGDPGDRSSNGRIQMTTTSGKRYAYLGHKIGWSEMDDGNTPAGEF